MDSSGLYQPVGPAAARERSQAMYVINLGESATFCEQLCTSTVTVGLDRLWEECAGVVRREGPVAGQAAALDLRLRRDQQQRICQTRGSYSFFIDTFSIYWILLSLGLDLSSVATNWVSDSMSFFAYKSCDIQ